jgi:hypothetical protein
MKVMKTFETFNPGGGDGSARTGLRICNRHEPDGIPGTGSVGDPGLFHLIGADPDQPPDRRRGVATASKLAWKNHWKFESPGKSDGPIPVLQLRSTRSSPSLP